MGKWVVSGSHPLLEGFLRLFASKLAKASGWLFAGSLAGGLLAYVFQVLMGRMLSTKEYALFSSIMAVFTVLATPLNTLLMVVARRVSEYKASNDLGSVRVFYYKINIQSVLAALAVLGVSLVFVENIKIYLNSTDSAPVYLLYLLLLISFLPIINNAFLQGLQLFNHLATVNWLSVLLKIVFSFVLVWYGYGVSGALAGTILSGFFAWLLIYTFVLYRPLSRAKGSGSKHRRLPARSIIPVLVANFSFTAMTQLDVVIVNHFFSAHDAGLYAAAATLGKAVMYLPGGIALALYPMVAENHAKDVSSSSLLIQAVSLTAALCLAGSVFYFLLGETIIKLLYGQEYLGAGAVLQIYGFASLPMGLVFVAENFLIAKGKVLFAYLFAVVAPLQLFVLYFQHDTLETVVCNIGFFALLLAVVGYGLLWRFFQK